MTRYGAHLFVQAVVLGTLAGGCGCDGGSTGAGAADGGTDAVALGPCTYEALAGGQSYRLPAPTHTAVVAYDELLDTAQPGRPANAPDHLFVDAEGVAIFGGTRFLRASLDGELLNTTEYPLHPELTDRRVPVAAVAQGPAAYGVIFMVQQPGTQLQFCLFDEHAALAIEDCPVVARVARAPTVTWGPEGFLALGYVDEETSAAWRFASDGSLLGSEDIAFMAWLSSPPLFLDDQLVFLSMRERVGAGACLSWFVDVLPASLDVGSLRRTELVSASDAFVVGPGTVASGGGHAALLYETECHQVRYPEDELRPCASTWPRTPPRATFLTVVGEGATPLDVPQRLSVPPDRLSWDGSRYVFISQRSHFGTDAFPYGVGVHAFRPDGEFEVWNARLPLAFMRGEGSLGRAQVVAAGQNDYILVYTMNDDTWIARFSLVPL